MLEDKMDSHTSQVHQNIESGPHWNQFWHGDTGGGHKETPAITMLIYFLAAPELD